MTNVRQLPKFPNERGQHGRAPYWGLKKKQTPTSNHCPPASGIVDQEQTAKLADDRNDAVDGLVLQGFATRNADLAEDVWSVVPTGGQLLSTMQAPRLR